MDTQPIKVLKGVTGLLELYPDRIVVRKTGWFSRLFASFPGESRTIYLKDLTSIDSYAGQYLLNGMLRFRLSTGERSLFLVYHTRYEGLAREILSLVHNYTHRHAVYPPAADPIRQRG